MARTLEELVNREEPAWPLVLEMIKTATNHVEVLPASSEDKEQTLLSLQITTRSHLGAIAYETGGILVDGGWLRILGAGCDRLRGNLASWNGLAGRSDEPINFLFPGALVVAHDAGGGFFAINGGAFGPAERNVFYFAPDSLEWMDCEWGYADFINWAFHGDLAKFYLTDRWDGWGNEVPAVSGDQGVFCYPPKCTKEGKQPNVMRKWVPMTELWNLYV